MAGRRSGALSAAGILGRRLALPVVASALLAAAVVAGHAARAGRKWGAGK
jgi:hypothetical protein